MIIIIFKVMLNLSPDLSGPWLVQQTPFILQLLHQSTTKHFLKCCLLDNWLKTAFLHSCSSWISPFLYLFPHQSSFYLSEKGWKYWSYQENYPGLTHCSCKLIYCTVSRSSFPADCQSFLTSGFFLFEPLSTDWSISIYLCLISPFIDTFFGLNWHQVLSGKSF